MSRYLRGPFLSAARRRKTHLMRVPPMNVIAETVETFLFQEVIIPLGAVQNISLIVNS